MTPVSPQIQRLLEAAGPQGIRSLAHLAALVQKIGFTGPITIHWQGGRPKQLDLGAPVRLSIVEGGLDSKDPPKQT
jgi:hypothetical protein